MKALISWDDEKITSARSPIMYAAAVKDIGVGSPWHRSHHRSKVCNPAPDTRNPSRGTQHRHPNTRFRNLRNYFIDIDAPETDQLCLDRDGRRWNCGIEARDSTD